MFPFWETVIAPVLDAAGARRIVEIGALRGENTVLMLEHLGADAELHVIDPLPAFDPAEHEAAFPGRYVFHRDISHNVLPALPPMDAALIDGDHNWYTVVNELRMLAKVSREAGRACPVMILHDVLWPYGRRDLYYAPERIPEDARQPYERRGIQLGRKKLHPRGGFNRTLDNAVTEGGKRNGVMTAVDDWMAEHDRPLRRVVLPIYFGLAIVVEEEVLAAKPELAALLDRLESADGRLGLLELSEKIRLEAAAYEQAVWYSTTSRLEQAGRRYVDLLKGSLLGDHHLELEVRLAYIAATAANGKLPTPEPLRDPLKHLKARVEDVRTAHRTGHVVDRGADTVPLLNHADIGRTRLDHLQDCLDGIRAEGVRGDLAEISPGRGGSAVFMRGYLEGYEVPDRVVWVGDPFRTHTPEVPPATVAEMLDLRPDINQVREIFERFGLLDDRVRFLQGDWSGLVTQAGSIGELALLRIGAGAGDAVGDLLEAFEPHVVEGGVVIVDIDDEAGSIADQIDAFRARRGVDEPLERIGWDEVMWRKATRRPPAVVATPSTAGSTDRVPLAPAPAGPTIDLSVVVVFYNMRREAARTLHALSRAYQRDIEGLDYEVLVYENGSAPDQLLGEDFVRSFGPEFRYVDMGAAATPSPTVALNRGIAESRGEVVALMIDGAHVLTPGALHFGMQASSAYEPALVATQQWYVGPGQQPDMMIDGYDQTMEDRLFEGISWPDDGYRLFEVGHFIGGRDWFDGLWESNCVFVPRKLLEQVGGFDDTFAMAGAGYANLDMYERLAATPGVKVATILGEGSFHQLHGGTTTNLSPVDDRKTRVSSYGAHYAELRGRPFLGPEQRTHYIGSMSKASLRTKARRMATDRFREMVGTDPDGRPERDVPLPEELRATMIDAVWQSGAWKQGSWLGQPVHKLPTDLMAYQELLSRVRPDWIVETGTHNGGRAFFLASICDLLDHGRVVSVDTKTSDRRPAHERITYVTGQPIDDDVAAQVKAIVGPAPHGLVILGSRRAKVRTLLEFGQYESLVREGSYVVIEETMVNGRPVQPGFGPGPGEAVEQVLNTRSDFASDPAFERYGLTFNPGGFLRRIG
jgi:cephalosporin hydroxylase